jgi:hypothetical protein
MKVSSQAAGSLSSVLSPSSCRDITGASNRASPGRTDGESLNVGGIWKRQMYNCSRACRRYTLVLTMKRYHVVGTHVYVFIFQFLRCPPEGRPFPADNATRDKPDNIEDATIFRLPVNLQHELHGKIETSP